MSLSSTPIYGKDGSLNRVRERTLVYDVDIDEFLDVLVPCSTPYPKALSFTASVEFPLSKGGGAKFYDSLCDDLTTLVSHFDEDARPSFTVTRNAAWPFPFIDPHSTHEPSSPDISVSFPGQSIPRSTSATSKWQDVSMTIHAGPSERHDPFPDPNTKSAPDPDPTATYYNPDSETLVIDIDDSDSDDDTPSSRSALVTIVRNTRTLMLVHGLLFAFAVGIYGERVRIARVDRARVLVSRPFNLKAHPELLARFFWHFAHPRHGGSVIGCDPTVRRLTVEEERWLALQLARAPTPVSLSADELRGCRRVEVPVVNGRDRCGGRTTRKAYFAHRVLAANPHLFSRSAVVSCVLEDRSRQDPRAQVPVRSCVMKDYWRTVGGGVSEVVFYERLRSAIQEEERVGIPRFVCGADLGEMEVREQDRILETLEGDHQAGRVPDTGRPQQRTCSSRLIAGPVSQHEERSHVRFVVEDIGRPLTEFKDTRELVLAVRDAIRGHRLAWEKAGVLHRDISLGNILIMDELEEDGHSGFIHDFDHSYMTPRIPGAMDDDDDGIVDDERMKSTGTFYFKAYELLLAETGPKILHEPHHDLESTYWVLLSVVLQHTAHNLAPNIANDIFPHDTRNGPEAAKRKLAWLFGRTGAGAACGSTATMNRTEKLRIKDNAPLTEMMGELRTLVLRNAYRDVGESPFLTYDAVLEIFDGALAKSGWPFDDWVPERRGGRKMVRDGSEQTNILDLQLESQGDGHNGVGSAVREAGAMHGKKRKLNCSSLGPDADRARRKSEGKVKVLRF
ncbi:hypothetical protein C8Q76DRAFT_800918 [Earliella scabrosa]|nr:hypothetical protein C8Q76DRAFT_800918 [Earliella scabrosa]